MDSSTVELLRSSLAHVLTEPGDVPLSARLSTLGWEDVLEEDATTALQVLFATKGTTLSPGDALGPVLARSIAASATRPDLVGATVVLPASLHPGRLSARLEGARLEVDGVAGSAMAGLAPPRWSPSMAVPRACAWPSSRPR